VALTDEDRWGWLEQVGDYLAAHVDVGAVISCSALKRSYRDLIRSRAPSAVFVHLTGDPAVAQSRMRARTHFMPVSLLRTQLETLEPLGPDERGVAADMADAPERIVTAVLAALIVEPPPTSPQPQPSPGV
jgi:gluconokinase